ncbi:hypothetical protein NECAME_01445 [Necator americanus]|uniref:Uncharacterized protein n=1 Tax=Necator americanus TaxID=51031 RepID=W2TV78_NECAM|nr:hypothetical protein NECAME_01445 [Necator americanus]ETN85554.1 hypothetical protein NECAME_01445 [Necator americanus]
MDREIKARYKRNTGFRVWQQKTNFLQQKLKQVGELDNSPQAKDPFARPFHEIQKASCESILHIVNWFREARKANVGTLASPTEK